MSLQLESATTHGHMFTKAYIRLIRPVVVPSIRDLAAGAHAQTEREADVKL